MTFKKLDLIFFNIVCGLYQKKTFIQCISLLGLLLQSITNSVASTEVHCLVVLKARSPRSRFWFFLRVTRENLLCLSSNFWWFSGNLWFGLYMHHLDLCLHVHMAFSLCVCVCVWIFKFLIFVKTLVILDEEPILLQYDLLTNHIWNDPICQ